MKMLCALAAGATSLALIQGPASGSDYTSSFVANVKPNIEFIGRSSRLALARSRSARVRAFAKAAANRQAIAENSVVAWWQTNTPEGTAAALGGPGTMFGLAIDKAEACVPATSVVSGIPVVSTRQPSSPRPDMLPAQLADLDALGRLQGASFDRFYAETERNSLRQLAAVYRDYAARGDDPALRSLSAVQLPRINDAIRQLNALP